MNKIKVWVYKDEEGKLKPFASIHQREGRLADFVQPDMDNFMSKKGRRGSFVKAELVEVNE